MTTAYPDFSRAEWFAEARVQRIFRLFAEAGEEARIVGGAVRNALMGRPVGELDFATTATPERITALAEAAGIKAVPTGFDHGTVTLVMDSRAFEVTTLREDVATDGRRAVVRFGRDWRKDALRRDFAVNALSVDAAGAIRDPVGGYPDIVARRVRFIGDADTRIAEDRLRILRLFRFHAEYGEGPLDAAGLAAAIRARAGLRDLSAERVGQEMRKLAVAPRAVETIAAMQESGILGVVLAGVGYLPRLTRRAAFEAAMGAAPNSPTRLGTLAAAIDEDVARITERLRLSNGERDRILAMLAAAGDIADPGDLRAARRILYSHGETAFRDGVVHAYAASASDAVAAWRNLYALPDRWAAPKFPLGGRDIIGGGIRGPAVGEILRAVEDWWIGEDFAPDETALRARMQQMIAAQQ